MKPSKNVAFLLISALLPFLSYERVEAAIEMVDEAVPLLFPHTPNFDEMSSRCGEVLSCSSGGIFYKPYEPVLPNERCIWMISMDGATDYEVTIQYFGYKPNKSNPEEGYGLIISDFGKDREANHFIPTNTSTVTLSKSNVLGVTFFSGAKPNKQSGFVLQYKAILGGGEGGANSQLISSDQYCSDVISIAPYTFNVLYMFSFLPENNIFSDGSERIVVYSRHKSEDKTNRMYYYSDSNLNCEREYFQIYFFNSTGAGEDKWKFQGRTCENEELIRGNDVILIVLQSKLARPKRLQFTYVKA